MVVLKTFLSKSMPWDSNKYGFFSCCSIKIYEIIEFFNKNKKLPYGIDGSAIFYMYKPKNIVDVTYDFFEHYNKINEKIIYNKNIEIKSGNFQFDEYKSIDYEIINPFVKKYFTPSQKIVDIENELINLYNINTNNCIGLYYRGTDKITETELDSFENYYNKLNEIINNQNNIQIIIQTDSAQFLDFMKNKSIQNIIVIKENDISYQDKGLHFEKTNEENYRDIKYLFATFLIISKCKYIICSSGNCSIWMMYFRKNANNVFQNLNKRWI
jgi:hypothetical protein